MNEPILAQNATIREQIEYETQMLIYQREQALAYTSRRGAFMTACKSRGHVIDRMGRRCVYLAINARGVMLFFDDSREALKISRESKYQPVRLIVIPILPSGTHWDTPIIELEKLIKEELLK